jgi:hypothetical protein
MPLASAIRQIAQTIRTQSATKACGDVYEKTQILGPRLHNSYIRQKRHYHNKQWPIDDRKKASIFLPKYWQYRYWLFSFEQLYRF